MDELQDHSRESLTLQYSEEAATQFYLASDFLESGDLASAEASLRSALQLSPDFAEAYANLGLILDKRDAREEAEQCYRRSLLLNPMQAETHLNLGVLLAKTKQFSQAEAAYQQFIALKPHIPVGYSNLGVLYACTRRDIEAERSYRTAIFLDDTYRLARFNLSYLLLRQGRFDEGWQCLEARNQPDSLSDHNLAPRWQGEPLAGKSILFLSEAGYGDTIQFCRYAHLLKAQGAASVGIICHQPLKSLLHSLQGIDSVIDFTESVSDADWDFWIPAMSIPGLFKTRLDSIPATIPYLYADAERIKKWLPSIPKTGLRVALVWKGNPLFENDADRSLPSLATLSPLADVPGVNLISLQKGEGDAEALHPPVGLHLLDLGSLVDDFADTAAIIANMDLVICVDTAIAHLAGALGKPCWVLLPEYKTDWRWLTGRTDSPWYPVTLRLFRQAKMGDWTPVIADVVRELKKLTKLPATDGGNY
ncbi:MAG: tetratricopeptide repeat protein [Nitrosomonadales bacterium]